MVRTAAGQDCSRCRLRSPASVGTDRPWAPSAACQAQSLRGAEVTSLSLVHQRVARTDGVCCPSTRVQFEAGSWSRAGADLRLWDSSTMLVAHQPAHSGSMKLLSLARPATPGRAGSGPREVLCRLLRHRTRVAGCLASGSLGSCIPPRSSAASVLTHDADRAGRLLRLRGPGLPSVVKERSAFAVAQRVVCCVEVNFSETRNTCL